MGLLNYELDIHGMAAAQAKTLLERTITRLPGKYGQITVIHGYQGGSSLQLMVRRTLKHKRIRQKILTMNPGETILLMNDPENNHKG